MKNFVTVATLAAGANALVGRGSNCCFHIDASGGAKGTLGQLDDGQNRIGGGLGEAQYCIDSKGAITDANGRGCILTPPTSQFQCDEGATPTPGFSINSQGQLEYNGKTDFVACETGQNGGLNIYTEESDAVTRCKDVKLSADSCTGSGAGAGSSSSSGSSSSAPAASSPSPRPSSSMPVVPSSPASSPASSSASSPSGWAPGMGGSSSSPSSSPASSSPSGWAPGMGGSSSSPSSSPAFSSPSGWAPGMGGGSSSPSSQATVPIVSSAPASSKSQVTVWTTMTTTVCNAQSTGFPGVPGATPSSPGSQTVPVVSSSPSGGAQPSQPSGPAGGGAQPSGTPSSSPSSPAGGGAMPSSSSSPSSPAGGGAQPSSPSSPAGGGAQPSSPSSPAGGGAQPSSPSSPSSAQPTGSGPSKSCPTNLNGPHGTPHLIIPVDSSSPDNAPGTSYNGTISSSKTTLYNFDIPQSYSDKTCSLVFLFPKQEDLETSAFTFSGDGKVDFAQLSKPVTEDTSYSNMPSVEKDFGEKTVAPGNSYVISTFQCPAGEAVSYEMKNAGSTYLDFFEDWNPSPIGLFITSC